MQHKHKYIYIYIILPIFLVYGTFRASDITAEQKIENINSLQSKIKELLDRFEEMSETELETEEELKNILQERLETEEELKNILQKSDLTSFSALGDLEFFMENITMTSLDKNAPIKNLNDLIDVIKQLPCSTCKEIGELKLALLTEAEFNNGTFILPQQVIADIFLRKDFSLSRLPKNIKDFIILYRANLLNIRKIEKDRDFIKSYYGTNYDNYSADAYAESNKLNYSKNKDNEYISYFKLGEFSIDYVVFMDKPSNRIFKSLNENRIKEKIKKRKSAIKERNMGRTEDQNIDDAMNDNIYYQGSFYRVYDNSDTTKTLFFSWDNNSEAIKTFFNWDKDGNLCIIKKEKGQNGYKILREKKIKIDDDDKILREKKIKIDDDKAVTYYGLPSIGSLRSLIPSYLTRKKSSPS